MADLFKATGGVKAQGNLPETWGVPASLFDSVVRNDGSVYGWNAATSTLTLPSSNLADGYLIIGAYEYHDTSNGRFNPQGKFVQLTGTGDFVGGPTGGYCRDTSEDRAYVRTWAMINNPSASATIQFQWKADADDATGGTQRSEIQVIPLYYSNIGMYTSADHGLLGGVTPNQVPGWSAVHESDTAAIQISGNVITVKGTNKRYLALGSQFFEGRGGRTQRWHGFRLDGSKVDYAKAYSYYRSTADDESGELFTHLFERTDTDITIDQFCYRGDGVGVGQGGADADGSDPGVGDHATVIIELNDSAEVYTGYDEFASANLATTGPVDISPWELQVLADAAAFTKNSSVSINANKDMDVLLGANISGASGNIGTGNRWTAFAEFTKNGNEDTDSFAGDYMRNNQGTIDTFGWSANLLGFMSVVSGDDIGASVTELPGSEGGGGGPITTPANWVGMWALNIDSLENTGGPTDTNAERSLEISGQAEADNSRSLEVHGSIDDNDERGFEIDGAEAWQIQRQADGGGFVDIEASININPQTGVYSYTDPGPLSIGVEYCYRVRSLTRPSENWSNIDCYTPQGTLDTDERSMEITGIATLGDDRSFEIHGRLTDNADRSMEVHGIVTDQSDRNMEVHGEDAAGDARGLETHGQQMTANDRSMEVRGQQGDQDEVSLEIDGQDIVNNDRAFEIDGIEPTNDARSMEIDGIDTDQNTRAMEIRGSLPDQAERSFEIDGAFAAFSGRGFDITGIETLGNDRGFEITGALGANDEISFEVDGVERAQDDANMEIRGSLPDNNDRPFEVRGKIRDGADVSMEIDGIEGANAERGFEIDGDEDGAGSVNMEVHGKDTDQDDRSMEIRGKDRIGNDRGFEIDAQLPANGEIGFEINGTFVDQDDRGFEVDGILGANDTIGFEINGFAEPRGSFDVRKKGRTTTLTREKKNPSVVRGGRSLSVTRRGKTSGPRRFGGNI